MVFDSLVVPGYTASCSLAGSPGVWEDEHFIELLFSRAVTILYE